MTEQPPPGHAESSSSAPRGSNDQLNQSPDERPQDRPEPEYGFVSIWGVDHYAARVDGEVWRTVKSADEIYIDNLRSDTAVKAGPTVAATFMKRWVPIELGRTRYGRCINITKYRRRGRI